MLPPFLCYAVPFMYCHCLATPNAMCRVTRIADTTSAYRRLWVDTKSFTLYACLTNHSALASDGWRATNVTLGCTNWVFLLKPYLS